MSGFEAVHAALRAIMLEVAPGLTIAKDAPGTLELRTAAIDPKTKQPGWFGAVTTKKSYVAYHLIPLYDDPALGDGMSAALAKRRQGKSCFNFKTVEPELFAELADLTRRARAAV